MLLIEGDTSSECNPEERARGCRRGRPVTACSDARPSAGRRTRRPVDTRCGRAGTSREGTRSAGVAGSLSRKEIVGDGARASIVRAHGHADSSSPRGAVKRSMKRHNCTEGWSACDHVLRDARRRSEHAEGCCVAPEHGWRRAPPEPHLVCPARRAAASCSAVASRRGLARFIDPCWRLRGRCPRAAA